MIIKKLYRVKQNKRRILTKKKVRGIPRNGSRTVTLQTEAPLSDAATAARLTVKSLTDLK